MCVNICFNRTLPDEAAHCQYEMKSFIRSDSGVLYPKGQGKLADPHNMHIDFPTAEGLHEFGLNRDTSLKQHLSKVGKDKTKPRTGSLKGHLGDHSSPLLSQNYSPKSIVPSMKRSLQTVGNPSADNVADGDEEFSEPVESVVNGIDWKARETRLTAYEDAIDSVIRKVQSDQHDELDDVCAQKPAEHGPGRLDDDVQELPSDTMKVEREARICDTIDSVIAQAKFPSTVNQGIRPFNEVEEFEGVHWVNPHLPESSPAVLPLQNVNTSVARSERTMSAKHLVPPTEPASSLVGEIRAGRGGKARKEKRKDNRPIMSVGENITVSLHNSNTRDIGRLSDAINHDIDEKSKSVHADRTKDDVCDRMDQWIDDDSRVPMAAAESLMKLAGVVPPQKKIRISFGPRNERTVKSPVISDNRCNVETFVSNVTDMEICRSLETGENIVESKHMLQDKPTECLQLETRWNDSSACQNIDFEEGRFQHPKSLKSNDRKNRKQGKRIKEKLDRKRNIGKKEEVCAVCIFLPIH